MTRLPPYHQWTWKEDCKFLAALAEWIITFEMVAWYFLKDMLP